MQVLKVTAVCLSFAAIHSFMASKKGKMFFRSLFGETFTKCWYRVVFVFVSAVMMSGVYVFLITAKDELLYAFPRWMTWPMHSVQVGGMFFGMGSLLTLNFEEYFGLSQAALWRSKRHLTNKGIGSQNNAALFENLSIDGLSPFKLATTGVYSIVRHPIYLAGILMITCQPVVTYNWLTVTIIADLYFITAAVKEQRTLLKLSGSGYSQYVNTVPMFNVFAGICRKLCQPSYGTGPLARLKRLP